MHGHGTSGFPSAPTGFQSGPPAWQPAPPKGQSRALTYVALAIAVIATALAVVGWFRPTPPPPPAHPGAPTYTEQQIADAKTRACSAFELVDKGVVLQTGGGTSRPEPSNDPVMAEARAADARLSLVAGSWYLRDHLDPATAPKLASAIRNYATVLADLAQNYLAGIKDADPAQESLLKDSDAAFTQLHELCQ
jgi:hypothetical protein